MFIHLFYSCKKPKTSWKLKVNHESNLRFVHFLSITKSKSSFSGRSLTAFSGRSLTAFAGVLKRYLLVVLYENCPFPFCTIIAFDLDH